MSGDELNNPLSVAFRDMIELRWSEFCQLEMDVNQDSLTATLTALVRATTKGNMRAIKESLDRIDGKVATVIKAELPKFYYIYPNAKKSLGDGSPSGGDDYYPPSSPPVALPDPDSPTFGSLKGVLERMISKPRTLPLGILGTSKQVELGDLSKGDPRVKSVIVAGLLAKSNAGNLPALIEVFEQIDGKVADKIKILGGDVYVQLWDEVAPKGAYLNGDGVYQIEAKELNKVWVPRLEEGR